MEPKLAGDLDISANSPLSDLDDSELIRQIAQKDQRAFSLFFDRASSQLLGIILRIVRIKAEAEDVLQDVFVTVWNQANQFDHKNANPMAWVVTMARRRAIDRVRSSGYKAESQKSENAVDTIVSLEKSPLNFRILGEQRVQIKQALLGLSEEQRVILHLCFFEGLAQQAAAEFLRIPLGTTKIRVRLTMDKLAGILPSILPGILIAVVPDDRAA